MTSALTHRGASGSAPESTLAAVEPALDQGADGVEVVPRVERPPGPGAPRAAAGFAAGVALDTAVLDAAPVEAVRAHGTTVSAWTVDDPGEPARVRADGAGAIITDVPAVPRTILAEAP